MSQPHVIRLNRAWELRRPSAREAEEIEKRGVDSFIAGTSMEARVDLPWSTDEELATNAVGQESTLLLSRRFNRPSNLASNDSVVVRICPAAVAQHAYFNGRRLNPPVDASAMVAVNVTNSINDHNRLDVVIEDAALLSQMDTRLIVTTTSQAE